MWCLIISFPSPFASLPAQEEVIILYECSKFDYAVFSKLQLFEKLCYLCIICGIKVKLKLNEVKTLTSCTCVIANSISLILTS